MQDGTETPASWNPIVEPGAQAFLNELAAKGGPRLYELSVEEARGVLSGIQSGKVAKLSAEINDCIIPEGPGGKVAVRIIRPKDRIGALPVVVYFHGGGWVLGDKGTHDRLI